MKSHIDQLHKIRAALRDYRTMTPALRRRLVRLGLGVIETHRHVRMVLRANPSISVVIPATGSDWRGGRDAAATLCRQLAADRDRKGDWRCPGYREPPIDHS